MFDADQILTDHVIATMPDSMTARIPVLKALRVKINAKHPAYTNVSAQLVALETIQELQAELQSNLPFSKEQKS